MTAAAGTIPTVRPGDHIPFFSIPRALPNEFRITHVAKQILARLADFLAWGSLCLVVVSFIPQMTALMIIPICLAIFIRIFAAYRDHKPYYTVRVDSLSKPLNQKGVWNALARGWDKARFADLSVENHLDRLLTQKRRIQVLTFDNKSEESVNLSQEAMYKVGEIGPETLIFKNCTPTRKLEDLGYFHAAYGYLNPTTAIIEFRKGIVQELGSLEKPLRSSQVEGALKTFKKGLKKGKQVFKLVIWSDCGELSSKAQKVYNEIAPTSGEIFQREGTRVHPHPLSSLIEV